MSEVYTRAVDGGLVFAKGLRNGQQWETVVLKEDTITIKRSIFHAGEAKSGKTWTRFEPYETTFWSRRDGRLRVYSKSKFGFRDETAGRLENNALPVSSPAAMMGLAQWYPALDFPDDTPIHRWEWATMSSSERTREMGKAVREAAYPLAADFAIQNGLTSSLTGTAQELVLRQFGQSRYRKDLVKGVGHLTSFDRNEASAMLKTLVAASPTVPVDWIITSLRAGKSQDRGGYGFFNRNALEEYKMMRIRKLFRGLNQKTLRRLLLNDPLIDNLRYIPDTIKSFELLAQHDQHIDQVNFASWKDLHDHVARLARRVKELPRPIVYEKKAAALVGDWTLDDVSISIVAPETTHDVVDWGETMGHCIGSYAKQAPSRSLLYAIVQNNEMIGNMESDPQRGDIRQLLGKYNARLPQPVVDVVKHAVKTTWPGANTDRGWGAEIVREPNRAGAILPAAWGEEF